MSIKKKISSIYVRISDEDRAEVRAFADEAGVGVSELIRGLLAREMRDGEVTQGLAAEPLPCGTMARVKDLTGASWLIYQVPVAHTPCLAVSREERSACPLFIGPRSPEADHWGPLQKSFFRVGIPWDWNEPEYRELCRTLGLDPDKGRPQFTDDVKEVAEAVVEIMQEERLSDRGFAADRLFDLLREDTDTWLPDWETVLDPAGEYYQVVQDDPDLRAAGEKVPKPEPVYMSDITPEGWRSGSA